MTTFKLWMMVVSGLTAAGVAWAEVPIPAPGAGTPMMTQMLADPDTLPALNTCIAAHPGAFGSAWVEEVMPAGNGRILIETNDLDGRQRECTAELKTGRLIKSVLMGEIPALVYVPRTTVRPETPSGPCFTAYPVVLNRQLHGWRLERELSPRCNTPEWLAPLSRPRIAPVISGTLVSGSLGLSSSALVSGSMPGAGQPPAQGAGADEQGWDGLE